MRIVSNTAPLLLACMLALSACDVRRDASETEPVPADSASPLPTPSESETDTPVASIIRDDSLPGPIIDSPPEPLRQTVPFGSGGTVLSEPAERVLAGVLQSAAMDETWPIMLRGHTDSAGNDRVNLRASRARAEAVAAWLVERGVNDDRIEVVAMGEQNPVAPNAMPDGSPNEAGRMRNRRVTIEIAPPATPMPAVEPEVQTDEDKETP